MQSLQPTKAGAVEIRLFFVVSNKMPTFAESRRDDGYISNFILTLPRPKIGAFFIAFGAVLLLSGEVETDNTLYFSDLQCVTMFKKRKPLIYNDRVTNGYCSRVITGVLVI